MNKTLSQLSGAPSGKQVTARWHEQCCDRHMNKVSRFRRGSGPRFWGVTSDCPDSFTSLCWLLSQLNNQPQARESELSLPGPTKHLRSQLAQCRQRYQDLQEKLLISEATVFAQANQLEKYRLMFSKSEVP